MRLVILKTGNFSMFFNDKYSKAFDFEKPWSFFNFTPKNKHVGN